VREDPKIARLTVAASWVRGRRTSASTPFGTTCARGETRVAEAPRGHASPTIVGTSTLALSGIAALDAPDQRLEVGTSKIDSDGCSIFRELATGVEVSDPSGDRRGHSQLPAASGVSVQASASGSTVALQTARGIYGGYRVTLPDRPSLRVSGCALLRGPARRKREFGGNALPCSFLPRSPWCGYLAVADGRGRAHA
jgi:hypothetical protein